MNLHDVVIKTTDNPTVKFSASDLIALTKKIEGKILTIAEASIDNEIKLQATKSLLRSALWDCTNEVAEWMLEQTETAGTTFPF